MLTAPVAVAVLLLDGSAGLLILPLGVLHGAGAAALGAYIGGDLLHNRAPELLATVTPTR